MNKQQFFRHEPLRFNRFSRKRYALFSCLGRVVLIGVLSVATVQHAKAGGIAAIDATTPDTLRQSDKLLEEIVVTGSRAPLTLSELPKIVAVVSHEDIDRAAVSTINDVLKLATGVDVRQRGGFGVQTDISIDGGTFDQIAILLNGMDISSPQTGHNAADFPIDAADIERIEVLRGAGSRTVGGSAFSGAVNIVTRKAISSEAQAKVEAGSYGTVGANIALNLASNTLAQHISGGLMRSDGGQENSAFVRRLAFYNGILDAKRLNVQWQAGFSSTDFGANTFYSAKYNNQYETTRRFLASGSLQWRPFDIDLSIRPRMSWHRDIDHYQLIRHQTGAEHGENYHSTDIFTAGADMSLRWCLGQTTIGAEYRNESIWSTALGELQDESDWRDIRGTSRQYSRHGNRHSTSLFAEHIVFVGPLTVSAGLLAIRNSVLSDGFRAYPGIDAKLNISSNWTLYASWNKAMRLPTYTDLYTNSAVQQGDINLKPERNTQAKIGIRYATEPIIATFTASNSRGRDMIDWVYETSESTRYQAMNIGKLNNRGLSVDIKTKIDYWWKSSPITELTLGYAFIDQDHTTSHKIYRSLYALEYLRHKLTASLSHRICKNIDARWDFRWQRRMNGYDPYAKLDVKIRYTKPSYQLWLQADNLTNHRYYDLGTVRQPGLWIMAGGNINIAL